MDRHVIVGAGAVGTHTARHLVAAGHEVRVVTRSGSGPTEPGIERVAADATDPGALARLVDGAAALYNCANPSGYHQWTRDWPPLAASLLATAERTGAVLVTMSNLYGYGPVDAPMTEDTPLAATGSKGRIRARMWLDALAAHEAGRARVTEARASDFFGPEGGNDHLGRRFMPKLLAGKRLSHIASPDVPHSWTYLPDVGRTLATLGTDERAWGRAWHVPTNPPLTYRQMAELMAAEADAPTPKISTIPHWLQRGLGLAMPMVRELEETHHQFAEPWILDSSAVTEVFGLEPTPMDRAVADTVAWWSQHLGVVDVEDGGSASM
ncbi:MAG: NAD-dependent epimerase/dehydratase family protein [Acidimicrobiales bacterium]